jgi:hypothetical protein
MENHFLRTTRYEHHKDVRRTCRGSGGSRARSRVWFERELSDASQSADRRHGRGAQLVDAASGGGAQGGMTGRGAKHAPLVVAQQQQAGTARSAPDLHHHLPVQLVDRVLDAQPHVELPHLYRAVHRARLQYHAFYKLYWLLPTDYAL